MKNREKLYDLLRTLPKCQLHLHLDGSLSFDFIMKTYERIKCEDSVHAQTLFPGDWKPSCKEELRNWLMNMKKVSIQNGMTVQSNKNWKMFDFCNGFLQTFNDISEATYDLASRLYIEHHVNYIEIRFAPILHTLRGLSMKDAVDAAVAGFNKARESLNGKLYGGIILCAIRSYPLEESLRLLPMIELDDRVLALDIAGDEGTYPLELFKDTINECKRRGIRTTVHAGEWPNSLHNIQLAAELKVDRIGHGIALKSASEELFCLLRNKNISVEINLTANCGNPLKVASFSDHPYLLMLQNNIKTAGLNCDNLLLSGNDVIGAPDPTVECMRALLDCKVTVDQVVGTIYNGYTAGFHGDAHHARETFMTVYNDEIKSKLLNLLSEDENINCL